MNAPSPRALMSLLLLQPVLFAVPMVVLGQAIGWPGSLRLPGSQALPLIHANAGAVQLGYWAYLLVSFALVPLSFAMRGWMGARGMAGWAADALAFTGAAAGVFKMLGIVRWLSAMPLLASQHDGADAPGRAMIETTFAGLNAYAGHVGELLGVQLVSGVWVTGIGAALVVAGHRVAGYWGVAAGLMFLAACLRTAVPELAVIQTIAVPVALTWFIAVAVSLRRGE